MNNDEYVAHLQRMCPLLATWRTEIKEIFIDESKLSAIVKADHYMTLKGKQEPAKNDFIWILNFDEKGEKVVQATEIMDSAASLSFQSDVKATAMRLQSGISAESTQR